MKKIKRITALCLCMLLIFTGCAKKESTDPGKLRIVCTIFPEYDWVREILGEQEDQFQLTLLMDNGVDLHSYQPTAQDIAEIAACDLFITIGGESDAWVEDALSEAANPDRKVIRLLDCLGEELVEEELTEGMEESEHAHAQGEEHAHEEEEEHVEHEEHEEHVEHEEHEEVEEGPEYDEHVWLSLRNAEVLTNEISSEIEALDTTHAKTYRSNTDAYIEKLKKLNQEYEKAVQGAAKKTLIVGDRFPFRYLVEDYGLTYYAAFPGCSAETEASFETITFLAKKVDELGITTILVLENSKSNIADTVIRNTTTKDQLICELNSIQSITNEDISQGADYLSLMEKNLGVIAAALQ